MRFRRNLVVLTVVVGAILALAGNAFASTTHATWRGWCGGPALTQSQFLVNLDRMGATGSASKFFGVQPLNESLAGRVHSTFTVAILARDTVIANEGCSGGALFSAGPKHLKAGTKVWIDMTSLRAKFPNGFSLSPKGEGWIRKVVAVQFRAQTSCTNPGKATVFVFVWIKVSTPAKPAKPAKPKVPAVQTPVCITTAGIPLFAVPPGLIIQNGVCVTTVVTTTQTCGPSQHVENNVCVNNTNVNTNTQTQTNTQTTTVVVNTTPPPVQTCQTPGATNIGGSLPCQFPPPCQNTVSVTTINDLDAGGNSPNFHVTVTMCGNDSGTLNVSTLFGSVPGGSSVTVSGQNTQTFTYYAPGEVPPGGQDSVTATVRDNVTGSVVTASTPKFNIKPPPPS